MTLEERAKRRLADVVALAPTKNSELQDRWDMDSGSEVHQYLESELKDYYYRNEDSLICATPDGRRIVQEAGLVEGTDDDQHITVPPVQARVLDVIAGSDDETQSVVSVYHALEDAGYDNYEIDEVRSALHSLVEKGVIERVRKTVPTFRLAVERSELAVDELE